MEPVFRTIEWRFGSSKSPLKLIDHGIQRYYCAAFGIYTLDKNENTFLKLTEELCSYMRNQRQTQDSEVIVRVSLPPFFPA